MNKQMKKVRYLLVIYYGRITFFLFYFLMFIAAVELESHQCVRQLLLFSLQNVKLIYTILLHLQIDNYYHRILAKLFYDCISNNGVIIQNRFDP